MPSEQSAGGSSSLVEKREGYIEDINVPLPCLLKRGHGSYLEKDD